MPQPQLNAQKLSDRAITIDCLCGAKAMISRDAISAQESAAPEVRQIFARMFQDHLRIQDEVFAYAQSKGWYQVPQATQQLVAQMPQHQPTQQWPGQAQSGYQQNMGTWQQPQQYGFAGQQMVNPYTVNEQNLQPRNV